jgi:hypothetical protein
MKPPTITLDRLGIIATASSTETVLIGEAPIAVYREEDDTPATRDLLIYVNHPARPLRIVPAAVRR